MNTICFWKTETIGNDFVLVRLEDVQGLDFSDLAVELCERRFAIGSDGLLVVAPTPFGISLRMFNPDGTEDFCGNGLRCAGWHAQLEGWVGSSFEILHGGRMIQTEVSGGGRVSITLPPADFNPGAVPVVSPHEMIGQSVYGLVGTAVSTGSAHFVALVEKLPGDKEFHSTSPKIETDKLFPEHISVIYTQEVGPAHLKLRIWERSVGETLGCGTGSVAAAVVWARKCGFGGEVKVSNPGGDLIVRLRDWQSPVVSESRPNRVYEGTVQIPVAVVVNGASLV